MVILLITQENLCPGKSIPVAVQYQLVSTDYTEKSNIQIEQVILRNIHVYTYLYAITISEGEWGGVLKGFGGGKGKCNCNLQKIFMKPRTKEKTWFF